ncbi:MAG: hypothetical protein FWF49_04785 [Oscillospiraceae bacterium]|nr:hypothetical protein [Oscillospiraceae bacterium]
MTTHEEWNKFLNSMISLKLEKYQKSKEYEYWNNRLKEIDDCLCNELMEDQKCFVDEILFEIGVASDHEKEMLYEQGMKDCVFILKILGVLA